jgi:hypothetical protein
MIAIPCRTDVWGREPQSYPIWFFRVVMVPKKVGSVLNTPLNAQRCSNRHYYYYLWFKVVRISFRLLLQFSKPCEN